MNTVRTTLSALTLALTVAGCADHRGSAPSHAAAPEAIPTSAPTSAPDSVPPTPAPLNPAIYAADGLCADELVRHYAYQDEFRTEAKSQLRRMMMAHKFASHYTVNLDRFSARVRETYVFLRDNTLPFEEQYRDFVACTRRSDGRVLSHDALNEGMAELAAAVSKFGPLPEPKTKKLIEE